MEAIPIQERFPMLAPNFLPGEIEFLLCGDCFASTPKTSILIQLKVGVVLVDLGFEQDERRSLTLPAPIWPKH